MATTPSANQLAAQAAVFGTNELLTGIVSHLGMIELIRGMRVNKIWRKVIQDLPDLKKRLFLKRDDSEHEVWYFDKTIDSKQTYPWVCISKLTGEDIDFVLRKHSTAKHSKLRDEDTAVPVRMNPLVKHEGTHFAVWGDHGGPYGKLNHEMMGLNGRKMQSAPSWRRMMLSQPPAARGIFMVSYGSTCADDLAVECVHFRRYFEEGLSYGFVRDGDATLGKMVDGVTWEESQSYMPTRILGIWSHVGISIDGILVPTDADRRQVEINTRNVKCACARYKQNHGQA